MSQQRTLAPGTELVVKAGEHYEIEDNNGEVVGIVAKESDWTVGFLKAFDDYVLALNQYGHESNVVKELWHIVLGKWNGMPSELVKQMPSFRSAIQVPVVGR